MHPLKLTIAALALLSVVFCEPLDMENKLMPFFEARKASYDDITACDTLVDDYMFVSIKSNPILEKIFSSLVIIPAASFLALALLHKSDFNARTITTPSSIDSPVEQKNLWIYLRPFYVAAMVLLLQKIFLYSVMFYPMTSTMKERIEIVDPLLMKPDQYLCYIMAYSIAQSVFSSIKINSFANYILACALWLSTRRVIRDLYLYLPRTGRSFMILLGLTGYTSYIYSNGGPSVFFKSTQGKRTEDVFSLESTVNFDDVNESLSDAANIVEHFLNFLTHIVNSIQVQMALFGAFIWYFSSVLISSSEVADNAGPMLLWKAISFFREDIKIALPFYIVKWTKLLPYSLTNTALPVVSTIGESLFFLTVYLCIAVVTHADEKLEEKSIDQYLPLGV